MKFSFINQDALLLVTGYLCLITHGTTLGAWWKTALMSVFFNRHSEECYNQFFIFFFFHDICEGSFPQILFWWLDCFFVCMVSTWNCSLQQSKLFPLRGPRFWLPGFQFQFCHLLPAWVQCSNSAAQPLQASVFSLVKLAK